MAEKKRNVEPGTPRVDEKFSIEVLKDGPILVYGKPPLKQQFIVPDDQGGSWEYKDGKSYPTANEPTALCRCGKSKNKPYCDGSHVNAAWSPELTADNIPLLDRAKVYDGPALQLTDNEKYCAFARFCDPHGQVWNLVGHSEDSTARELTIREANYCPAGRLKVMDKKNGEFLEQPHEPSLVLLEDPAMHCSGPLWVKGGIPINDDRGTAYEQRNRVTLCRCGASANKPFCNGAHVSVKFKDGLPLEWDE